MPRGTHPVLVHATCIRPYSHSLSDDEKLYKTKAERADEAARDHIVTLPEWLIAEGLLDRHGLELITHEVDRRGPGGHRPRAQSRRRLRRVPRCAICIRNEVDPTSDEFDGRAEFFGRAAHHGRRDQPHAARRNAPQRAQIVVFGEDVADASREANLSEVKGKGGVFKATQGLQIEFGSERCFNTPIAEAGIVGRAIGMATRGLKPVAEIQFFDYIWPAMMQIRDELATMRWRSNNAFSAPAGDSRGDRRISERRRDLSQPVRRSRSSRTSPACAWCFLRTRWTPAACCAPPSAATIRCCSSNTSACIASLTTARRIPGPDYTIPFGKAQNRQARRESDHRHLRRAGAEIDAGGRADRAANVPAPPSKSSTCARSRPTIGRRFASRWKKPAA